MPQSILIRGARQLLTLRGTANPPPGPRRGIQLSELSIIPDGAVLINHGIIQCVGPTRRLDNLAGAKKAKVIDATGMIVMPGFIDCDCRLFPSAPLKPAVSASKRKDALLHKIAHAARCGTLARELQIGPGLVGLDELKWLDNCAMNTISTYVPEKLSRKDIAPMLKKTQFQFLEIPSRHQRWTGDDSQSWLEQAANLGCLMKARATNMESCQNLPVQQICWEGEAGREDIQWAATQDWVLSGSPMQALEQGGGNPQWRAMLDSGVALALATGASSRIAGAVSMQLILALACTQMGLNIAEAITATTMNAAYAMGIQDITGSIEPGKRADLLILDVPDYREIPYHLGINLISKVILHGKILFQQPELEWLGA